MQHQLSTSLARKVTLLWKNSFTGVSIKTRKSFSSMGNQTEENKINVNGININYARVGTGEHPVLLLPGAVGSIWTDFKPQMEKLNREKFTVIGWDPPGYGKSRPPARDFPEDFFEQDAGWAHDLMKGLGYDKFSLIGWSDGGITSLILAATYPEAIRKMVAVAANAYIMPEEEEIYKKYRNIDSWSEKMKAPMIDLYGEEYFRTTWSNWVDAILKIAKRKNGNLCRELLPKIHCPTLIVQGTKDPMVHSDHPLYLQKHITSAKLHMFENGAHNLHLRYSDEFNTLVTNFLTDGTSKM